MEKKNHVFIATSLDGFIADKNGGIDWLHSIPNPDNDDMGYAAFFAQIDALVMGRRTFETICAFDVDWPYQKPVFVLSSTMTSIPEAYEGKAFLVHGTLPEIIEQIHAKGFYRLYIDGGRTIQGFLKEDRIDEITITVIPYLLGGGVPLFAELAEKLSFECVRTTLYLKQVVQNHFLRKR
jgi:dihydrofolate reductase